MAIVWPAVMSAVGATLQGLVAWYVFCKNPKGRANIAFLYLSLALMFWQIASIPLLQYQLTASGSGPMEYWDNIPIWGRMRYFGLPFVGPALMYLVSVVFLQLSNRQLQILRSIILFFPLTFLMFLLVSMATQSPYLFANHRLEDGVWIAENGWLFYYNMAQSYGFVLLGLLTILYFLVRPRYKLQKKQAGMFTLAIIFPFVGNVYYNFVGVNYYRFDVTPVLFMIASFFFAWGIVKYKLFLIEPAKENRVGGGAAFDLTQGQNFVVYEERPSYALDIFSDLVRHDIHGLGFIPGDIKVLRKEYSLARTPLVRVSSTSSPAVLSYENDDERDYIFYLTKTFTSRSKNSVILVGGLEQLFQHKPVEAKNFLQMMSKNARLKGSRILLSISSTLSDNADMKELLAGYIEL